jgi:inner membrane protein
MDSFTHLVLGGSFAALAAPPARRRLALIAGAVIATLPDLDVFLPHADPVAAFTEHRGFTHSILVLPGVVVLLWALGQWLYAPMRAERGRWLLAIALALLTHPVVDCFTVYGTQFFWPLDRPPVMLSSIFIIDPLFTLPLLVGWIAAWRLKDKPRANFWLAVGLMASSFYLTWSWVAKQQIEQGLRASLAARGMCSRSPRRSIPSRGVCW